MAREGLEFVNGREWEAAVAKAAAQMVLRSEGDLVKFGLVVQNEVRGRTPVDTGRLRSSITASGLKRDSRGPYVEVGTNVTYAAPVEFGARGRKPAAMFRQGLLAAARRWGR